MNKAAISTVFVTSQNLVGSVFIFIYFKIFLISLKISSLTHVLFNLQVVAYSPYVLGFFFLLLISSSVTLWSESRYYMIPSLLNC